ncbi:MAG: pyridoxamine 5'-phosphate oxidase family protein [Actinomycetota bacterium]|nr:pyridoxamine 5'-phosphate oxidase family protein [Actinomycetota bacterium]
MVLEKSGRTISNINANQRVAMVVSSGQSYQAFLQCEAEVTVVTDDAEEQKIREALLAKVPEIEPFFGAPIVSVQLRVQRWRATDVGNGWLPGRDLVAPSAVTT